ncbi:MAG: NADH-quinone oxidoreductase subunit C [Myxococcaceae bacterium]
MPALSPEQLHQKLSAQFGDAIGALGPATKDPFCTFSADKIVEICEFLRTTPGLAFDFLEDLTATDHPKQGLIKVVYVFYSYEHRHIFRSKVELPRAKPEVHTIENVWKAANWLEREVYDLFGVTFLGHSDLRRIMLPDDWVGHPLRKDYVEQGGYQDISNVRDNPLDQYLSMDRVRKAEQAAANPPPAPGAPPASGSPTPGAPTSGSSSTSAPSVAVASPAVTPAAAPAPKKEA